MRIGRAKLKDFVLETAERSCGDSAFDRSDLLDAAESRLRREGHWATGDDGAPEDNAAGRAAIDSVFSELHAQGRLDRLPNSLWRLSGAPVAPNGTNGTSRGATRDTRRERLAKFAGRLSGPSIGPEAFDRSRLY